jgi:hypothetical protein
MCIARVCCAAFYRVIFFILFFYVRAWTWSPSKNIKNHLRDMQSMRETMRIVRVCCTVF